MGFLDERFPTNVSFHAVGGPIWSTDIPMLQSGFEFPNQLWEMPRYKWEVAHAARTKAAYDALLAFFLLVKGRANGFRFKDWVDYSTTSATGVFVMLTSTTFQMHKLYTVGSTTFKRKITRPRHTVTVTGGSGPSVEYTTGVVTVASGTPATWSGEFDVPCRFDTDEMQGEIIDRSKTAGFIMGWKSIPIIEIRE